MLSTETTTESDSSPVTFAFEQELGLETLTGNSNDISKNERKFEDEKEKETGHLKKQRKI